MLSREHTVERGGGYVNVLAKLRLAFLHTVKMDLLILSQLMHRLPGLEGPVVFLDITDVLFQLRAECAERLPLSIEYRISR